MEEEMLTSPENSGTRTSEIAPLQLESHNNSDRYQTLCSHVMFYDMTTFDAQVACETPL